MLTVLEQLIQCGATVPNPQGSERSGGRWYDMAISAVALVGGLALVLALGVLLVVFISR